MSALRRACRGLDEIRESLPTLLHVFASFFRGLSCPSFHRHSLLVSGNWRATWTTTFLFSRFSSPRFAPPPSLEGLSLSLSALPLERKSSYPLKSLRNSFTSLFQHIGSVSYSPLIAVFDFTLVSRNVRLPRLCYATGCSFPATMPASSPTTTLTPPPFRGKVPRFVEDHVVFSIGPSFLSLPRLLYSFLPHSPTKG